MNLKERWFALCVKPLFLKIYFGISISLLSTSVIMDSLLWISFNFLIPSYTIAIMSACMIIVISLTLRENLGEKK